MCLLNVNVFECKKYMNVKMLRIRSGGTMTLGLFASGINFL